LLELGYIYRVERIEGMQYVVVEGHRHPGGGIYWTEFEKADGSAPTNALTRLHPGRIDSARDDERLSSDLECLLKSGVIEEIPVAAPEHPMQEEHWYRHRATGEVYSFIPSNFPARGRWRRVV